MKSTYLVSLQGVLPVIGKIQIQAENEWEAGILAGRIAESQRPSVKSGTLEIEAYPADFLVVEGVSEITAVDPEAGRKIWNREQIETLLDQGTS
jgi:hypothetical protein